MHVWWSLVSDDQLFSDICMKKFMHIGPSIKKAK